MTSRLAAALARRRVPLGFAAAAITLVLAQPTWITWSAGLLIALAGECVRIWAAGHLEKGREVTRSGPYRFVGHPLYVGSTVIAGGIAVAARSVAVAVLVAIYMSVTIAAAIRTEELELRRAFGSVYDDYRYDTQQDQQFWVTSGYWGEEVVVNRVCPIAAAEHIRVVAQAAAQQVRTYSAR
jgi:protein-S-isoprenylcysteine O-methyltransferase Ste14